MAAIMVKELEISEELDRKALDNIIGGQPPMCCPDAHACTYDGELNNTGWIAIWELEGACCCVRTEIRDNVLKQIWEVERHYVGIQTVTEQWACDFCAVGCP